MGAGERLKTFEFNVIKSKQNHSNNFSKGVAVEWSTISFIKFVLEFHPKLL